MNDTEYYEFHAALLQGDKPIYPRDGFAFHRISRRVFFLGFNKTATSALWMLMSASGLRAIHSSGNGKLFGRPAAERQSIPHAADHIAANLVAGRDPIKGLEAYDVFMDLTVDTKDLCLAFEAFYAAHPNALFVLNTRPEEDWLRSRCNHRRMLKSAAKAWEMSEAQVQERWRSSYRQHHNRMRGFFADTAPEQFLEWDIASPVTHLVDFLQGFGIRIDPEYYFRLRETDEQYYPPPLNIRACKYRAPILRAQKNRSVGEETAVERPGSSWPRSIE